MIANRTTTRHANAVLSNLKNLHLHYNGNYHEEQFKLFIRSYGVEPPEVIFADGQLHRFKINGKLNGAYILHLDGRPAGFFQDFKQGIKVTWKAEGAHQEYTDAERQAYKLRCAKKEKQRQEKELASQAMTARKAMLIWNNSTPAPENHPYLLKKRIKPHNTRLYKKAVVVPIYNSDKQLVNLQFIDHVGEKRYLKDGKKKGCFYPIGNLRQSDKILICEGFATGASLFEDSGCAVIVAFDAGNLRNVAIVTKSLFYHTEIVVCGDNDISGLGQSKAIEAALAIKAKHIIPLIAGQDFNDLLNMEGAR